MKLSEMLHIITNLTERVEELEAAAEPTQTHTVYEHQDIPGCTVEDKDRMSAEGWELYKEEHHLTLPASGKIENGQVVDYSAHLYITASFRRPRTIEPCKQSAETPLSRPLAQQIEDIINKNAGDFDPLDTTEAPPVPAEEEVEPEPVPANEITVTDGFTDDGIPIIRREVSPLDMRPGVIYESRGTRRRRVGVIIEYQAPSGAWRTDMTANMMLNMALQDETSAAVQRGEVIFS